MKATAKNHIALAPYVKVNMPVMQINYELFSLFLETSDLETILIMVIFEITKDMANKVNSKAIVKPVKS